MDTPKDHWLNHVQQWERLGSPLRPHAEDIAVFQLHVEQIAESRNQALKVILLGVTPELVQLKWPEGTHLYAIERCAEVAAALWPQQTEHQLVISNWLNIPFADNTVDLVIGDGCFTTLESPNVYASINTELSRVLVSDGFFIHRFFTRPNHPQSLSEVLQQDESNFHAFKWRLAMALQPSFSRGILVDDIWKYFVKKKCTNKEWTLEESSTINSYRHSKGRYTFPSRPELHLQMAPYFRQIKISHNHYTLAQCCPIILYQKAQAI